MFPRLDVLTDRQCGVFTRAQALACGCTDDELTRLVRSKQWHRQRYGVYADGKAPDERTEQLRALWAAVLVSGPGNVIAGPSAAVVHRLEMVDPPAEVHLVSASPRTARGIRVIRRPRDVSSVELEGLPVTDLAQTVTDCAATLDFADAVVVADSALRTGRVSRGELMADASTRYGARVARVVAFADGASESVGESLARVALDAAGLPRPQLQAELFGASGRRYRGDFYWPEFRVIGEFDGKGKYTDPEVLWREKRREDDLRAAGYTFARYAMADVYRPVRLGRIVRGGFSRARASATVAS